jgi:oligopeptide transport system ATP-binding protein
MTASSGVPLPTTGGGATAPAHLSGGAPAPAPDGVPLLEVRDLEVYFPIREGLIIQHHVGDVRAVDGVTFSMQRGETLGLVGESGCGKSTTGRAIIRLTEPTAGSVLFDGIDMTTLGRSELNRTRRRMQMIFQDPYSSLDPRMTAGGIVSEPLDIHSVGTKPERRERVRELLATVGLNPDYAVRYPHEFSGGQRQRIGVARALALDPDLIVADEPISALDVSIQAQIINLLERLQAQLGLAYLFIAHDLSVVRHISDRIAVMYLGRIVEVAPSRELNTNPLHPYSVALLSAVPVPDPTVEARRRRIILRGDVPSPVAPPSGCRFHTRCWLRERLGNLEECTTVQPELRLLASGHEVACHFAERVDGTDEQRQATGRGPAPAPGRGPSPAPAMVPIGRAAPGPGAVDGAPPANPPGPGAVDGAPPANPPGHPQGTPG